MPKLNLILFLAPLALLAACGGGGGGGSRPEPTPPPPPPPPPGPSSNLDDAEYRASTYSVAADALVAYDQGATGQGAKIAVIDSGIQASTAEFAGLDTLTCTNTDCFHRLDDVAEAINYSVANGAAIDRPQASRSAISATSSQRNSASSLSPRNLPTRSLSSAKRAGLLA